MVRTGFVLRIRLQLVNGREHCRGRQWHTIAILGHTEHPCGEAETRHNAPENSIAGTILIKFPELLLP